MRALLSESPPSPTKCYGLASPHFACKFTCDMQQDIRPEKSCQSSSGKSCLECRRRKIKCDKILPCSYCVKVKVRCTYPPRKTIARDNSQSLVGQELTTRIESIECTLKSVEQSLSRIWQIVQPAESESPYQSTHEFDYSAAINVLGNQASSTHDHDGKLNYTSREHLAPKPLSHPSPEKIFFLWQTFLERVHPVLKIIHAPSFQCQIVDFLQGRRFDSSSTHCLLFAIYYAAVVTLSTEECERALDHEKRILLQRYQESIETALSQADGRKSKDMTVLQALTLYTICGRFYAQGPDVRSLTSVAIELAFENGLNEENSCANIPPFEAEMRRRIWWQIFVLDTRIAEDYRSEPRILESQFHQNFPSSISDAALDPHMSEIPKVPPGKSEMLFSLVRLETSYFTRLVLFSDQFTEKNSYPAIATPQEKCEAIDRFKERIELEYLSHCDTSIPLDFVTAESSRLIIAKLKLTVTKPRDKGKQQVLTQGSFRETCVEILRRVKEMRLHERCKQWLWLFQTYIEWDALTYLLISLSISPLGDGVDAVWTAAEEVFQYWDVISDSRGCSRWRRIVDFHTQALTARERALSNPDSFGPPSNRDGQLEDSESIATERLEPGPSADIMASPAFIAASQVLERQGSSVEPQRPFNRISEDQSAELAREPPEIPSSGTACQWSAALFEQYFQILHSEHNDALWL